MMMMINKIIPQNRNYKSKFITDLIGYFLLEMIILNWKLND